MFLKGRKFELSPWELSPVLECKPRIGRIKFVRLRQRCSTIEMVFVSAIEATVIISTIITSHKGTPAFQVVIAAAVCMVMMIVNQRELTPLLHDRSPQPRAPWSVIDHAVKSADGSNVERLTVKCPSMDTGVIVAADLEVTGSPHVLRQDPITPAIAITSEPTVDHHQTARRVDVVGADEYPGAPEDAQGLVTRIQEAVVVPGLPIGTHWWLW